MKVLLTNVKTNNKYSDLEMKYLYGVLADAPIELEFRTYENESVQDIYENIMDGYFDLVYMHTDSESIQQIRNLAQMIKKAAPDTGIMLGGMEVSFETHDFMKDNPYVDYVVRGEAEIVMYNFIKAVLEMDYRFESMAGLAYRTDDKIVVNPFEDPIDMSELPFPYERIDCDKDVAYYESMRGTSDRSIHRQFLPDPRIRTLNISRVCSELRYFLSREVKKVVFFDYWFNFNSERAYRIFEFIIANDNGKTKFEFNINGDNLDEETIRLLADARKGLFIFNIDIGSTNAEVLDAMGRRANVYQLMYNVTKLMKSGNVDIKIIVASGLPYETETMFARAFNKAYGLADGMPLQIEQLYAKKGSTVRKQAERYGYIHSEFAPYDVIASGHMSPSQLLLIKKISRVADAYLGSGCFKESFRRILNDTAVRPYELFKSLSIFYRDNAGESKLERKDCKARVLHAFAKELYGELSDESKFKVLEKVMRVDLEDYLTASELKKFDKGGWAGDSEDE